MRLYCKPKDLELVVVAAHTEGEAVAETAYGPDVIVMPYDGSLGLGDLLGKAVPDLDLSDVKTALKTRIDVQAERLRMRMITPGSGQAMEYQEAQAQAAAALKAPNSATATKYPMLAASIGIDIDPSTGEPATDVLGVARSVDAARSTWLTAGAAIRSARLTAKKGIDEAATVEAALGAASTMTWFPEPAG